MDDFLFGEQLGEGAYSRVGVSIPVVTTPGCDCTEERHERGLRRQDCEQGFHSESGSHIGSFET